MSKLLETGRMSKMLVVHEQAPIIEEDDTGYHSSKDGTDSEFDSQAKGGYTLQQAYEITGGMGKYKGLFYYKL